MLRSLGITKRTAWIGFDILVLVLATVGIVQLAFWLDRAYPVEVHFRVIETISVAPGEDFRYLNFFTRHKYCETRVDRWFVGADNVIRPIDPLPAAMPTEGLNQRQMSQAKIKVPRDMPPGISKSCFRSEWRCNPVQQVWPLHGPETCITFLVKPHVAPVSGAVLGVVTSARLALEDEP